jgi:hypothetical protein
LVQKEESKRIIKGKKKTINQNQREDQKVVVNSFLNRKNNNRVNNRNL